MGKRKQNMWEPQKTTHLNNVFFVGKMQASIQRARASAARGLQSVRRFSAGGSPEELKKETLDWKKYSIGKCVEFVYPFLHEVIESF